jgi:hypothetical protein
MGREMKRSATATVSIVLGALALLGCGGGGDASTDSETIGNNEVAVATVPAMLGVNEACRSTVNLLSVAAQMVSGQVTPDVARSTIERYLSDVPAEIRDDAEVLAGIYLAIVDAIEKNGGSLVAAFSDPEAMAAIELLDSAETTQATDRINDYITDKCDIG